MYILYWFPPNNTTSVPGARILGTWHAWVDRFEWFQEWSKFGWKLLKCSYGWGKQCVASCRGWTIWSGNSEECPEAFQKQAPYFERTGRKKSHQEAGAHTRRRNASEWLKFDWCCSCWSQLQGNGRQPTSLIKGNSQIIYPKIRK